MTTYTLDFEIDDKGLNNIDGMMISLAKTVTTAMVSGNLATSWISFLPAQNISVTWEEEYYIYASQTQLSDGAKITMESNTNAPVSAGQVYKYGSAGTFTNTPAPTNGAFETLNQRHYTGKQDAWTMGLAQAATVNGGKISMAPLNGVIVPYHLSGSFTPIETVSMWLSQYDDNGVVISQVGGGALTVQMTSQSPQASIGFNDAENSFFQS